MLNAAKLSNGFRQRALFAVVIYKKRVHSVHLCDQASGRINPKKCSVKYHKSFSDRGATRHAERAACQEIIRRRLISASIVLFQLRDGVPDIALPCQKCSELLFESGLASAYKISVHAHDGEKFVKLDQDFRGTPSSDHRRILREI